MLCREKICNVNEFSYHVINKSFMKYEINLQHLSLSLSLSLSSLSLSLSSLSLSSLNISSIYQNKKGYHVLSFIKDLFLCFLLVY